MIQIPIAILMGWSAAMILIGFWLENLMAKKYTPKPSPVNPNRYKNTDKTLLYFDPKTGYWEQAELEGIYQAWNSEESKNVTATIVEGDGNG